MTKYRPEGVSSLQSSAERIQQLTQKQLMEKKVAEIKELIQGASLPLDKKSLNIVQLLDNFKVPVGEGLRAVKRLIDNNLSIEKGIYAMRVLCRLKESTDREEKNALEEVVHAVVGVADSPMAAIVREGEYTWIYPKTLKRLNLLGDDGKVPDHVVQVLYELFPKK